MSCIIVGAFAQLTKLTPRLFLLLLTTSSLIKGFITILSTFHVYMYGCILYSSTGDLALFNKFYVPFTATLAQTSHESNCASIFRLDPHYKASNSSLIIEDENFDATYEISMAVAFWH
jgi:hypothetical protein